MRNGGPQCNDWCKWIYNCINYNNKNVTIVHWLKRNVTNPEWAHDKL